MKKLIWGLVIVAVGAVFGSRAWWLYQHRETENNALKIGLLTVQSGQYAQMGQEVNNGAILAMEEINSQTNTKIQLLLEDSKAVSKDALNAFNKLLFSNVKAAVVVGDNQILPTAHLIDEKGLPTVVVATGSIGYLKQNNKHYMYHFSPSNYSCSFSVGKYAKDVLNLKKVAVLKMNSVFGEEGAKGFADGYGQSPMVTEEFKMDEQDAKNSVLKILDSNPDGIYITGYGASYVSAIKRLKEYGFSGKILSEPAISNLVASFNPIKMVDGILFAEAKDLTTNSNFALFSKNYEKRFGQKPTAMSAQGYEAVRLLYNAYQANPENIQAGLIGIKEFDNLFGKVTFSDDGNSSFEMSIKQMQPDGSAKIVKE